MRIKVVDGPVRHNIELFQDILRRANQREPVGQTLKEKLFKIWVNRETGQFFINEVSQESSYLGKNEWKSVELICAYDPEHGEVCFLIEEPEASKGSFRYDDLTKVAYRIMRETMKTLNEVSHRLKGPSDLETKMSVILKLEIDSAEQQDDKSLLIKAWHHSDRLQAEDLLWNKPAGTFLFRKDHYAEWLEVQLQRHHDKEIKCITLTFSQPGRKFSDLTIIYFDGRWMIYNDDPCLEERKFNDIQTLLIQMRDLLKYPLYH